MTVALFLGIGACGGGGSGDSKSDCTPGASSCACRSGDQCDDGLMCESGLCTTGSEVSVALPNDARSCELLLEEDGAAVLSVDFADNTTGAFIREAPRVAVAFHANSDAPMGELRVHVAGDGTLPSPKVAHCFDAMGAEIDDVELPIGG